MKIGGEQLVCLDRNFAHNLALAILRVSAKLQKLESALAPQAKHIDRLCRDELQELDVIIQTLGDLSAALFSLEDTTIDRCKTLAEVLEQLKLQDAIVQLFPNHVRSVNAAQDKKASAELFAETPLGEQKQDCASGA